MITKKQWKTIVEKIVKLRKEGKEIYYKDWQIINRISLCALEVNGNPGDAILMEDDTRLTHKSFMSLKDAKKYLHWIEIHNLEF